MKPNKINVGLRIKSVRQNKGMTLEEFGKLFNASKSIASRWEKGISLPNAERLKAIAKIGDMTVDELLHGSSEEIIQHTVAELTKGLEKDFIDPTALKEGIIKYVNEYGISDTVEISNVAETYVQSLPQNNVELMKKLLGHITNSLKVKSFIDNLSYVETLSPYNHFYIRYMATILIKALNNLKKSNLIEKGTTLDKTLQVTLLQKADYWKSMQLLDELKQETPHTDMIDLEAFIESLEKNNNSISS